MFLRVALSLALLAAVFSGPVSAFAAECAPHYEAGFAALSRMLGDQMGDALTCEFPDPNGSGDVHQKTTLGLAFWRKSTNTPTFTNGFDHWGLTAQGALHWTGSSIDPPGQNALSTPRTPAAPVAPAAPKPPASNSSAREASLQAMVQDTVADVNAFWARTLRSYQPARIAWYTESVDSPCGHSTNAGPFYCSGDGIVYLQRPFLQGLWDNGWTYGVASVLAHEIGHHVQRLSGIRVVDRPTRPGQVLSINAELGADCLGGVWVADASRRSWLPADALDQARQLTFAAGDPAGTAQNNPRAHGSSQQRLDAFSEGLSDRDARECLAL